MTKQEKIQEAYGEYPTLKKHLKGDNGWCGDKFGVIWQKYKDNELFEQRSNEYETNGTVRLKSLIGIENNNSWIKIENDSDLPKEDLENCYIIADGSLYRGHYVSRIKKFYGKRWSLMRPSHYQPISLPQPPLY